MIPDEPGGSFTRPGRLEGSTEPRPLLFGHRFRICASMKESWDIVDARLTDGISFVDLDTASRLGVEDRGGLGSSSLDLATEAWAQLQGMNGHQGGIGMAE